MRRTMKSQRLRRIERAAPLAQLAVTRGTPAGVPFGLGRGVDVEHAFVHRAQLVDAEIGIINGLPASRGRPGRERHERGAKGLVLPGAGSGHASRRAIGLHRGRPVACEQPPVEWAND